MRILHLLAHWWGMLFPSIDRHDAEVSLSKLYSQICNEEAQNPHDEVYRLVRELIFIYYSRHMSDLATLESKASGHSEFMTISSSKEMYRKRCFTIAGLARSVNRNLHRIDKEITFADMIFQDNLVETETGIDTQKSRQLLVELKGLVIQQVPTQ